MRFEVNEIANMDKINIVIPEERWSIFRDGRILEKIKHLLDKKDIVYISVLPDVSNDKFSLSGVVIESNENIYPSAIGWDPGCGFRVLHINKSKEDLKYIESKVQLIEDVVSYNKNICTLKNSDIEDIINNPIKWCKNKGITGGRDIYKFHSNVDKNIKKSTLNFDMIRNYFGGIAKGNHFMEFRYVSEIEDKEFAKKLNIKINDVIATIHSGSGAGFKRIFMKYYIKAYLNMGYDKSIDFNFNGYKVFMKKDCIFARSYANDCLYAENFAIANRQILTHFIRNEIHEDFKVLLDEEHDHLEYSTHNVVHRKGSQVYSENYGIPLAYIPGTMTDSSFLICRIGESKYINHGVGEGEDGVAIKNFNNVITNSKLPLNRKYYNTQHVMNKIKESKLARIIAKMEPWICIKNIGGKDG